MLILPGFAGSDIMDMYWFMGDVIKFYTSRKSYNPIIWQILNQLILLGIILCSPFHREMMVFCTYQVLLAKYKIIIKPDE